MSEQYIFCPLIICDLFNQFSSMTSSDLVSQENFQRNLHLFRTPFSNICQVFIGKTVVWFFTLLILLLLLNMMHH